MGVESGSAVSEGAGGHQGSPVPGGQGSSRHRQHRGQNTQGTRAGEHGTLENHGLESRGSPCVGAGCARAALHAARKALL